MINRIENTFIVGYSLDSVIHARELANKGMKITYMETGKLGYPYDKINEYLREETYRKIVKLDSSIEFKKFVNFTYIFFPYEMIEFANSRNGLISYPINKNSFETAEEIEQIENCAGSLEKFHEKLTASKNFINLYKRFFPKWLYDTVIKNIGINKWCGISQTKLTKEHLVKEINTDFLTNNNSGIIYKPEISYEETCKKLLSHPNITIKKVEIRKLKEFLVVRQKGSDVIFMDNRIDYLCGFSQGKFERVSLEYLTDTDVNMEEFIDLSEGVVLTPMKDYWCSINELGKVKKIYSSKKIEPTNESVLVPSLNNVKTYSNYKKLINMYSGKKLNLDTVINVVL